jgi:membrane protein involved in colicin uptake
MWPFTTRKDRRIADLEARDQHRVGRIKDLETALHAAAISRTGSSDREQRQADRIIRLERQAETVQAEHAAELERLRAIHAAEMSNAERLHRELAEARRQLRVTQKQLDDATKGGDAGLLAVRPRPADKGQVTA